MQVIRRIVFDLGADGEMRKSGVGVSIPIKAHAAAKTLGAKMGGRARGAMRDNQIIIGGRQNAFGADIVKPKGKGAGRAAMTAFPALSNADIDNILA